VLIITGITHGQQALDQSLQFEVDLSFTSALKLWRLRSRYIIPKGYRGWVRVYYRERGAPLSPTSGDFNVLRIPASGILHTSSDLRNDSGDAQYVFSDGNPISASGLPPPIWGGDHIGCDGRTPYQVFFVGTDRQYERAPKDKDGMSPSSPCKSGSNP
jgi:hypothetical protein